jgi:hypothetical protein
VKFTVIAVYEDMETYVYSVSGEHDLQPVLREIEEKKIRLVSIEELNRDCWVNLYGPRVDVLLPMDLEAVVRLKEFNEEMRRREAASKNVLTRHHTTPAFRSSVSLPFDDDVLVADRYVFRSAFEVWGRQRALVPFPTPRSSS